MKYQIVGLNNIDVSAPKGRETYCFGVERIGGIVGIGMCITLSCLHNNLWTSDWILTKFLWIYNWDITKDWLDFDDLDLIFKDTVVEKLKIEGGGTSVSSENTVTCYFCFWKFISICGQANSYKKEGLNESS